jgi:hypothetical protein
MGEGGVKMGAHCRISGPLKEHELYSSNIHCRFYFVGRYIIEALFSPSFSRAAIT